MRFADATSFAETSARNPSQAADSAQAAGDAEIRATVYTGEIHPGWDIMGNANGGYTMSMFARAALIDSGRNDVISVSAHFLSPGKPGPVQASVEQIKNGKKFATSRVELRSNQESEVAKTVLSGTVITGNLDDSDGPELIAENAPDIPDPESCVRVIGTDSFPPPFSNRIDQRIDPATAMGSNAGPVVRGWMRLLDDEPMDTIALILASDSLPPTVFNTDLEPWWVPTVQMTIHVRRRPQTNWLLLNSETRFVTGGMFEVDNTIYDEDGDVLAHSRQLQLLGLAHSG